MNGDRGMMRPGREENGQHRLSRGGHEGNGSHRVLRDAHEGNAMLDVEEEKPRPSHLDVAADHLGIEKRWLIVLLALVVVAMVLLVVIVVMAISWPESLTTVNSTRCETQSCTQAAALIKSRMPVSASSARESAGGASISDHICSDYWKFSCSEWLDDNPVPRTHSLWNVRERLIFEDERRSHMAMATMNYEPDVDSYRRRLARFFNICEDKWTPLLKYSVKNIVDEMGGFSFTKSARYRIEFERAKVIRWLQLDQAIDALFAARLVHDPSNNNTRIQISPGDLGLEDLSLYRLTGEDKMIGLYERYIRDVIQDLGATSHQARQIAEVIRGIEKRMARSMTRCDPTAIAPCPLDRHGSPPRRRIKIFELMQLSPLVEWQSILSLMFPTLEVDKMTEVFLVDHDYFSGMSRVISSSVADDVNDFLMWRYVATYLPYLVEQDRVALDMLNAGLTGVVSAPPRWLTCTRLTRRLLPLSFISVVAPSTDAAARQQRRLAVQTLLRSLTQTIAGYLTYSPLLNQFNRAQILAQVGSMSVLDGFPAHLLQEETVKKFYWDLRPDLNSYLKTIQRGRQFERRVRQSAFNATGPDADMQLLPLLLARKISYDSRSNRLVVPEFLLQSPFFQPDFPAAMQYAGLGVALTEAVLTSIGPLLNCSSADKESVRYCACVGTALPLAERLTAGSAFSLLTFQLTAEAFDNYLKENGERSLPGLESVSAKQLFYVHYGQNQCGAKTRERIIWDKRTQYQLDGAPWLELVASQSAGFADLFKCNSTNKYRSDRPQCYGIV